MTAPSWMTEGAHPVRRAQIERDYARRERRTGGRVLPRVSLPVDADDAEAFPNIAAACEHVRRKGLSDGQE